MSTADPGPRRHMLKAGLTFLTVFVVARPARSQPANGAYTQTKLNRALVNYQDAPGPGGHDCGTCKNCIAPTRCRLVPGEISPAGHCLSYAPRSTGAL